MQRKGFSSSEKQLEWFFSDFLCLPWGFSDALLCCDGALDVDVMDPFHMVGARLAPGGSCRARAAAGHIRDIGFLICAMLQPQSLSQAVHRAADTWELHPPSPLVRSVAEVSLRAAVAEVSPQLQKPRL